MSIFIREITALETHAVRHPVLRKGLPVETCIFNGDMLETTFHLGAFESDTLVGVATFLIKDKSAIQNLFQDPKKMYQLRGMGVLENQQGKGIGNQLVQFAEQLLKKMEIDVVWFHARTSAVPFYQKLGYISVGEEIFLKPAGPHFKMYKEL